MWPAAASGLYIVSSLENCELFYKGLKMYEKFVILRGNKLILLNFHVILIYLDNKESY